MTSLPGDSDDSGSAPLNEPAEPPRVVCAGCGTSAEGPPVTWTCSVENGARHYFCEACARANLRAIEGRLDSAWW
ncbi:hypothetical protein ACIPJS_20080 [Streptomyces sp. NPDC086783]|uniref:hypothetical protein n=1 Tax=Streptomyces sp. NPDC086783 TaxID=3365758 RepID=UPI00381A75E6